MANFCVESHNSVRSERCKLKFNSGSTETPPACYCTSTTLIDAPQHEKRLIIVAQCLCARHISGPDVTQRACKLSRLYKYGLPPELLK